MTENNATSPLVAPLLQSFFGERLIEQRRSSTSTIATYRDTFRLLLRHLQETQHKCPSELTIADLDASYVLEFLNNLECVRKNSIRTRNVRLSAIRSFLEYAGWRDPLALPVVQRVRAIPIKRFERPLVSSLNREQTHALLDAPDSSTISGRRDRAMLTLMYNTGARVSEVIAWRRGDLSLGRCSAIQVHGKGRKERSVPLWRSTATVLRSWLKQLPAAPETPLLPNARGRRMTRSGVEHRLRLAVQTATARCPSLRNTAVSPHVLRHTTAMHLLQSGVELSVIALWLGHESPATTHHYLEADLAMKRGALDELEGPRQRSLPKKADDKLLKFLESL